MHLLLNTFIDICLFRKGPQDLPASPALLRLCLFAYGASGLVILMIDVTQLSIFSALLLTLLDIGLMTAFCYGVLYVLSYLPRFTQTLTALSGIGTLLQLIALPLVIWIQRELRIETGNASLPALLHFFLLGWFLAVMGHIMQHALSTSRSVGVLYAVAYFATTVMIFRWLLPPVN
jgi:hypothetical protein